MKFIVTENVYFSFSKLILISDYNARNEKWIEILEVNLDGKLNFRALMIKPFHLQGNSGDWFLYDGDLRDERVKSPLLRKYQGKHQFPKQS